LVGHSFSGLLVRLFAYLYPQEVAGLVLLDPAHEDQFLRFPQPIREMFTPMREGQIAMLQQNAEIIRNQGTEKATPVVMPPPAFPAAIAAAYAAQSIADSSRVETMIEELRNLERTQEQVRAQRLNGLGELPVTVVSHGIAQEVPGMPAEVNQAYEAAWQEMQGEMAGMSSRGKQVIARESGHMIHHQQPELVIEEIERIVMAWRI
jgi:pimeloyl-ACP methyl ester carboxylesterase